MGFPDSFIPSHKCGERHRLGRRKRRVPPGAMFSACYLFSELTLVGSRNLMLHELLLSVGMLALTQPREMFRIHGPGKVPLLRKLTLPFAVALLVAVPVVLFLRGKLTLVISSRLTGSERLRDRKHGTNTYLLARLEPSSAKKSSRILCAFWSFIVSA